MNTAHDALAAIERQGQDHFTRSGLSRSHAAVTRRVRTARVTQGALGTAAAVGVVAAAGMGYSTWRDHGSPTLPGAQPATASGTVEPSKAASPQPSPHAATLSVSAGSTVDGVAQELADAYGVSHEAASAAIADAVNEQVPEARSVEGWVADGDADLRPYATVEEAAGYLVGARVAELTALGVERDSWQDILTAASLVEEESARPEDKAKVARVIANRLATDMPLQLESPLRYSLESEGAFLTQEETEADTPYNTYANKGLPPGAIAIPSHESLEAALNPAPGDWLYFVTVNLETGETAFAATFEEHQANVARLNVWVKNNTAS